jgi:hypothetical protein
MGRPDFILTRNLWALGRVRNKEDLSMKRILLASFFILILTACVATATPDALAAPVPHPVNPTLASTLSSPDGATGIEGQVSLGPMCPVAKKDEPCPDQPYQATLTVLTPAGEKILQFTTDAEGKFHLDLAPGNYLLRPESPKGQMRPRAQEQPFSVSAGQYTSLNVQYDSGMR